METPASRIAAAERSDHTGYRADLDGLRAVSIIVVVAFHIGLSGFQGGFVGVDIFFVISGFLIIGQIRAGIERGSFSIFEFYARRALRILPPYLLMLAAVAIVAPFVLVSPKQYEELALSAVTAPLMLSNIYFFLKFGYFDLAADLKPLLHTWTLSVEEQFYIFAPILLVVTGFAGRWRGRAVLSLAIVLLIVSFLGNLAYANRAADDASFFLAHWRAWQFIAGGLVGAVSIPVARRLPIAFWQGTAVLGLACILAAVFLFDPAMDYPSWPAVLPVGGAVLLILSGAAAPRNLVSSLLASRPMVGIGLVSYAWYLWHWPILSFTRIANLDERWLAIDLLGGGLFAFLLAVATYFWVELPVRNWRRSHDIRAMSRRIVYTGMVACTAALIFGLLPSGVGYIITRNTLETHYRLFGDGEDLSCQLNAGIIPKACRDGPIGIVIGDSHAAALYGSFAKRLREKDVFLTSVAEGGCNPLTDTHMESGEHRDWNCEVSVRGLSNVLSQLSGAPNFVIINARWSLDASLPSAGRSAQDDSFASRLRSLVAKFADNGVRVILVGPVPVFGHNGLTCVVLTDRYGMSRDTCLVDRVEIDRAREHRIAEMRQVVDEFPEARFIDPVNVFCDDVACRPFEGDTILYVDDSHVGAAGADRLFDANTRDLEWAAGLS